MSLAFQKELAAAPVPALAGLALAEAPSRTERSTAERAACFHCGEPCADTSLSRAEKHFCCQGCLAVHEILSASGLEHFYDLAERPGMRVKASAQAERWQYLDAPTVQQQLLDFTDGKQSRITFHIPAIHCVACVWLLENLFRLNPAIGESKVNFARREVAIRFAPEKVTLSGLVALLASIGYEPQFTLGQSGQRPVNREARRRWLQLGVAGFAFGNIMLFSIPLYLGLDSLSGPVFRAIFGYLSLALALPVLVYSAADYWKGAWVAVQQRMLTLDVPIALGLAALFAQSAFEICSGRGEGYLDSLAGLIFFLLCGRAFQQKTFERMAFDRDFKSFFPLATLRKTASGHESAALSELKTGDVLVIRNGELIPADSVLLAGQGLLDYSFVTGESESVQKQIGEHLYAGGKQTGSSIEVEMVRAVSQSYLASLWDHQAFRKPGFDDLNTLTNRYSRRFTRLVIGIAVGAALFWTLTGAPARGLKAFTSVLIVACPCALALAAPFALGTVQRLLARAKIFLKNTLVLERLSQVDAIVFDKTGTLTSAQSKEVEFKPTATNLNEQERGWVTAVAAQSIHPHALRICARLKGYEAMPSSRPAEIGLTHVGAMRTSSPYQSVSGFCEYAGCGIEGRIDGHQIQLGSAAWLLSSGVPLSAPELSGSASYLAIDGEYRGAFLLGHPVRPQSKAMLAHLSRVYELALLSGDSERERAQFQSLLGSGARLHFNQSPLEKLQFIIALQKQGRTVLMVGDGLNDAGALKQSDAGIAVVEQIGLFSPASDVILEASRVPQLHQLLELSRKSAKAVRLSFLVSAIYNLLGVSIAAWGIFSPLICAVLMPLSSLTVVLFACGAAHRAVKRAGLLCQEEGVCT